MGRAVTKNSQGELEVTETLSFSGATPTIDSVKLVAVDGKSASDQSPSWLGFSSQSRSTAQGSELDITLELDATGGLSTYTSYTFEIAATDDAGKEKSRRVNVGIGSLATTFSFALISGQEDKYRSENGQRVERGGIARVTVFTSMPATLGIEYVRNPSNVDDPTFTQSKSGVSQDTRKHEFFFSVVPSSLYAFRVMANADYDQSVPNLTSSVYYFNTGSQISRTSTFNVNTGVDSFEILSLAIDTFFADHIDADLATSANKNSNNSSQTSSTDSDLQSFSIETVSDIQVASASEGNLSTNVTSA